MNAAGCREYAVRVAAVNDDSSGALTFLTANPAELPRVGYPQAIRYLKALAASPWLRSRRQRRGIPASARSCCTAAKAGFGWKFVSNRVAAPSPLKTPGTQEYLSV